MGEVFLDAALDTLKLLPFLLAMNIFIELLERRSGALKAEGALNGRLAPLFGAVVGVVPQCGFSVVATELYAKRKIALGTLLAVYIATSDEALPIMLSSYAGVQKVLPVIVIKLCFALIVGYATLCGRALFGKRDEQASESVANADNECEYAAAAVERDGERHVHGCHRHTLDDEMRMPADAAPRQKAAFVFEKYFEHPLIHTATVLLYIFGVNALFGIVVFYIGTDRLAAFIGSTGYLQPFITGLVGLIPNCAASVVITELYVIDGLSLGGAVSGLCVGAGIGYAVLAKLNKSIKNTAIIIGAMYVLSVALGLAANAAAPLF